MKTRQITLGVLVLLAGLLLLLSNINVEPVRAWLGAWWPLFVILLGAYLLWENARSYTWPLFLVVIGGLLLVKTLGLATISLSALIVPLLLLVVGINILTATITRRPGTKTTKLSEEHITAILGGASSKNQAREYTGGSVTAILGGVELDLRQAEFAKEAVLHVSVAMGGIEIRVPENVVVNKRTQAILGGVEDKAAPTATKSAPVLVIEGPVIMGGIEIRR